MNIEIIAIADEILKGMIVNTNSTFLSERLTAMGLKVSRHSVFRDHYESLLVGIREALTRSDLVICTGGLGPTIDDITRSVAAEIFNSSFIYSPELAKELEKRFGRSLASLQNQATVPEKACALKNAVGTAPGFVFEQKGKRLILLPGVPAEMRAMFEAEVLPLLKKELEQKEKLIHRTLNFCIINENRIDPWLRQAQQSFASLDLGVYPSYGSLTVSLRSTSAEELNLAEQMIVEPLKSFRINSFGSRIEQALFHALTVKGETVAFAESCTGGLLSQKMTALPGVSSVFLGSVVAYSNALKQSALSVEDKVLTAFGAVSAEVAAQMLDGLFALIPSDYGIAVTGIAGPEGGTEDKPVGTVWLAIGKRGSWRQLCRMRVRGERELVIAITSGRALACLTRALEHGVMPFDFQGQNFDWLETVLG